MGSPASVNGTTFAPDRTATVTWAPAPASSLPISAPEFPTPTTSTRRPAYPSGRRVRRALWARRPANRSCPGKWGGLRVGHDPRGDYHAVRRKDAPARAHRPGAGGSGDPLNLAAGLDGELEPRGVAPQVFQGSPVVVGTAGRSGGNAMPGGSTCASPCEA